MIPDKIYLAWEYSEIDVLPPGVTTKQAFKKDVEYIRKDALIEWLIEGYGWVQDPLIFVPNLIDKLNSM